MPFWDGTKASLATLLHEVALPRSNPSGGNRSSTFAKTFHHVAVSSWMWGICPSTASVARWTMCWWWVRRITWLLPQICENFQGCPGAALSKLTKASSTRRERARRQRRISSARPVWGLSRAGLGCRGWLETHNGSPTFSSLRIHISARTAVLQSGLLASPLCDSARRALQTERWFSKGIPLFLQFSVSMTSEFQFSLCLLILADKSLSNPT